MTKNTNNFSEGTLINLKNHVFSRSYNTVSSICQNPSVSGFLVESINPFGNHFTKFIVDMGAELLIVDTFPNITIPVEDRFEVLELITQTNNCIKSGCIKLFENGTLHICNCQRFHDIAVSTETIKHLEVLNTITLLDFIKKLSESFSAAPDTLPRPDAEEKIENNEQDEEYDCDNNDDDDKAIEELLELIFKQKASQESDALTPEESSAEDFKESSTDNSEPGVSGDFENSDTILIPPKE